MSVGGMSNTGGGGGACAGGGSGVVLISYPQSAENVKTAPDISLSPATNVASDTATINGSISDTGGENPTVTVYWGDNDGGQTPGVWDHSYTYSQAQGAADFSKDITGLTSEKLYYFSAKASNSIGTTWASAYLTFTTTVAAPKITNIVVNEQGTIVAESFGSKAYFSLGKLSRGFQ